MISIPQPDRLGLGATFEHLRTAELEILDENDAVAIGKHSAVGILDNARAFRNFFLRPFKTAGDTLPFVGVF